MDKFIKIEQLNLSTDAKFPSRATPSRHTKASSNADRRGVMTPANVSNKFSGFPNTPVKDRNI